MIDIPCRCGHHKDVHPAVGKFPFLVCDGCFRDNRPKGIRQIGSKSECREYIPDNLMFVEQLAKLRRLI